MNLTYITGFMQSGYTYIANDATEMILKIVTALKIDDLGIMFLIVNGYFMNVQLLLVS